MAVTTREGDVLLYHGTDFVSQAIMAFDGTDYSHVSVRLNVCDDVAECLAYPFPGSISQNSLQDSMVANHTPYVLVRRMKNRPADMSPVTTRARFYLQNGNTYAYGQIVQLAFLCSVRKLFVVPGIDFLLRTIYDAAALALDQTGDKKPMICSEFVNRCFHEAQRTLPNPYALFGQGWLQPSNKSNADKDSLIVWAEDALRNNKPVAKYKGIAPNAAPTQQDLESQIKKYLDTVRNMAVPDKVETIHNDLVLEGINRFINSYVKEAKAGAANELPYPDLLSAFMIVVDNFITPGDFYHSNDLQDIGRINAAIIPS
jgi:hypothetical protein